MNAGRRRPPSVGGRREKGSGSISSYATKAGTRWRYEIDVPVDPMHPESGTRKTSRAGFSSFDEADDALTLLRADLIRKVPQAIGRDTFAGYAQRWADGYGGSNGTRLYIQRAVDGIDPYIGHLRLTDIRPTDLAAAYRGLENGLKEKPSRKRRRKGLATSTVARYANWVNTIFLAALDEGLIVKNPANSKHAGRPKGEKAKRVKPFTIWNVDELTRFCDWSLAEDEPWARAFALLSRTGLRSGELLALRWGDLDFNRNEMRIERALHDDESLPLTERYVIGQLKGGRPRSVTFDKTCAALLQDWRKELPALLAGGTGNVTPLRGLRSADPVFPSTPGRAASQSGLHAAFQRVQKHYRAAHPDLDLPRLAYRANALFDAHQDDPEFGYRFLADEARDAGIAMAERTAWKICSDNGWWSAFGKKRTKNGKRPGPPVHDDLCAVVDDKGRVRHEFKATAANELWIGDITEHWTSEGKLYACAFKDVFSNRIVGYSIDSRMKSSLAVRALNNAVARRGDVAGCVVHTDRGSQFRSRKFVHALNRHRMVGSMGRVGAAGDNAAMESFFSLLQKNVLNRRVWATREELRIAIVTWIEKTYHRRRRQDALGRLTPIEYETIMTTPASQAA